jgi:hypothetical protein
VVSGRRSQGAHQRPPGSWVGDDQWWQWIAFTKNGQLATSYDDCPYGDDETTGFSEVSLSGSGDLAPVAVQRRTSAPLPPPTPCGGVFFGDYTGLTAVDNAHRPSAVDRDGQA